MPKLSTIAGLEVLEKELLQQRKTANKTLILCGGTGCTASGCQDVIDAVNDELLTQGMESEVNLRVTGCHGFCEQGPIAIIEPGNIFYCHLTPKDAHDIVSKTLKSGEPVERLLYTDDVTNDGLVESIGGEMEFQTHFENSSTGKIVGRGAISTCVV